MPLICVATRLKYFPLKLQYLALHQIDDEFIELYNAIFFWKTNGYFALALLHTPDLLLLDRKVKALEKSTKYAAKAARRLKKILAISRKEA